MDREFEDYIIETRDVFISGFNDVAISEEKKMLMENLLSCFNQMYNKLKKASNSPVSISMILNKNSDKNNVANWIDEWRMLFPEGKNFAGYPYRGDRGGCLKKMIAWCNSNPQYTKEAIFSATKEHIRRYRGNYTYLQQAHYFISKDGISTLLAICEFDKTIGLNKNTRGDVGQSEDI